MKMRDKDPVDRAKQYIQKYVERCSVSGCWNWTGGLGRDQRGAVWGPIPKLLGVSGAAHRVSYRAYKGPIAEGLSVRHRCNNSICVNPDHLELGTHARNMLDKREPLGERSLAALHMLKRQIEQKLQLVTDEIENRGG